VTDGGDWPAGPLEPTLSPGRVHVWSIDLERPPDRFVRSLSADERSRAARFRFAHDRARYVVAHGALRALLGRYLQRPPASIGFRVGPRGKPALAQSPPALHFNLAHSESLALVAVALGHQVGVDVERLRPLPDLRGVAAHSFSPAENTCLAAVPAGGELEAFYQCWTRKEAIIKATGEGLNRPLDSFDVTLGAGRAAAMLRLEGEPGAPRRWTLLELRPATGFVGAIAAREPSLSAVGWRFGEPDVATARHLFHVL
jgi:4'-phosphopantetheinyl transferase